MGPTTNPLSHTSWQVDVCNQTQTGIGSVSLLLMLVQGGNGKGLRTWFRMAQNPRGSSSSRVGLNVSGSKRGSLFAVRISQIRGKRRMFRTSTSNKQKNSLVSYCPGPDLGAIRAGLAGHPSR